MKKPKLEPKPDEEEEEDEQEEIEVRPTFINKNQQIVVGDVSVLSPKPLQTLKKILRDKAIKNYLNYYKIKKLPIPSYLE